MDYKDVAGCAKGCQEIDGCQFFIFEKNGDCFWEKTESADCPEGFVDSDAYNFYKMKISKLN